MLNKLKAMDKKMLVYLGIGFGSILFIIILIIVLKIIVGSRINSKTFESRVKDAAVSYYKEHKKELPKANEIPNTISIEKLVDEGYLKDPDSLLKKGVSCKGNVNVSNNNGYYLYQPVIECSDKYKTNLLYKQILSDNKIAAEGDGLYQIQDYFLFKGEKPNNFVSFAGRKWRILRINNDNSIRMILYDDLNHVSWDDRYNVNEKQNVGKNDFNISRIKEYLIKSYKEDGALKLTKDDRALLVPTELCIGAKAENSLLMDGSVECSKKTEKMPLGLLQINEYTIASLDIDCKKLNDIQCKNYNFVSKLDSFWTLNADSVDTSHVYRIDSIPESVSAVSAARPRFVVNISENALYNKGIGTEENPYIIK